MAWRLDLAVSQGQYPPIENEAIGNYTSHVCEDSSITNTRTEFGLVDFAGPLLLTFVGATGPRRAGRSSALRVSDSRTVLRVACQRGHSRSNALSGGSGRGQCRCPSRDCSAGAPTEARGRGPGLRSGVATAPPPGRMPPPCRRSARR
jgi:hypothetical protein